VSPQDDCLFCRIVSGAVPSRQAYADETVIAFHDVNPGAPTHVLVVPRRHIEGMASLEAEDGALLSAMAHAAKQVAHETGIDKTGYRLVWNVGPDAGQSVFHLHLHVIGGRKLAWPPG
jgi:histidine triad (HIT) family protein